MKSLGYAIGAMLAAAFFGLAALYIACNIGPDPIQHTFRPAHTKR